MQWLDKRIMVVWWSGAHCTNICHHILNSIEISFHCNSAPGYDIATNFCTRHEGAAVVPCANICSDRGSLAFKAEHNEIFIPFGLRWKIVNRSYIVFWSQVDQEVKVVKSFRHVGDVAEHEVFVAQFVAEETHENLGASFAHGFNLKI